MRISPATVSLFVGTGFVVVSSVAQQARTFRKQLPDAVERLKDLPLVGPRLQGTDRRGATERVLQDLPKRLNGKTEILLGAAQAATSVGHGVTALVAAVFLLLDGPSTARSAQHQILDDRLRETARRLASNSLAADGGSVRDNLFIGFVASMVVVVSLEVMR